MDKLQWSDGLQLRVQFFVFWIGLDLVEPPLHSVEVVDANVLVIGVEIDLGKLFDLGSDRGGKEQGLNVSRQVFHDLIY